MEEDKDQKSPRYSSIDKLVAAHPEVREVFKNTFKYFNAYFEYITCHNKSVEHYIKLGKDNYGNNAVFINDQISSEFTMLGKVCIDYEIVFTSLEIWPYILLDAEKNKDGYYVPNEEEIVMYRSKILFPEYITSKHEGDEFIRFTIEDMNISIKNALNFKAKKYIRNKEAHKNKVVEAIQDEYDSFTKRVTEGKERILKAHKAIEKKFIEKFNEDLYEEDDYIYQHQQVKLVTSAMAYKYAENKGDIMKLMDSFEKFSDSMAVTIYHSIKNDLSNFCLDFDE